MDSPARFKLPLNDVMQWSMDSLLERMWELWENGDYNRSYQAAEEGTLMFGVSLWSCCLDEQVTRFTKGGDVIVGFENTGHFPAKVQILKIQAQPEDVGIAKAYHSLVEVEVPPFSKALAMHNGALIRVRLGPDDFGIACDQEGVKTVLANLASETKTTLAYRQNKFLRRECRPYCPLLAMEQRILDALPSEY